MSAEPLGPQTRISLIDGWPASTAGVAKSENENTPSQSKRIRTDMSRFRSFND